MSEVIVDNERLSLGQRIGKGGEGEVFGVDGKQHLAVKIYTTSDKVEKESKILAMVQAHLSRQSPFAAFPLAIARARDGSFLGFVMRKVDGHKPIHNLYAPGSRKQHFPEADYRFLVRGAANIARAVASVHQTGCVIGDINHSSMLVSNTATVALIDADSFQLPNAGPAHLCKVGVPEYTPPELIGADLSTTRRTGNHDAFGLAITIFQLLCMGRHPYAGMVRIGEAPALQENIRNHRFVYAEHRNVGMDQPPGTPVLSEFTSEIASAFEQAFSNRAIARPTAQEWIGLLERLESSLVRCNSNALHYSPRTASSCIWCEMEQQFGTPMFVPPLPKAMQGLLHGDLVLGTFNLDAFWIKVDALLRFDPACVKPILRSPTVFVSAAATQAAVPKKSPPPWGTVMIACVLLLGVATPAALFFLIGSAFFFYRAAVGWGSVLPANIKPFHDAFVSADMRWGASTKNWYVRLGNLWPVGLTELEALKAQYLQLPTNKAQMVSAFRQSRERSQLYAFLATFDIEDARLAGIGPSLVANLMSFGFDNAADLDYERLLAVPGIGDVKARRLVDWRQSLAKRFRYNAQETASDRQNTAQIDATIRERANNLAKRMNEVYVQLTREAGQVQWYLNHEDVELNKLYEQREQARKDLVFLGITPPSGVDYVAQGLEELKRLVTARQRTPRAFNPKVPPYAPPAGPQQAPRPAPVVSPSPVAIAPPSCPRCHSTMVRRQAKRGPNAGGNFWGCSRYPTCRGTRNI